MSNEIEEDVRQQFAKSKADFKEALEYAIQISNGMHGSQADAIGMVIYDLFTRNISAGLTFELLIRPPQWTNFKAMPSNFSIWDYSSLCIIARAMLETCISLFYFAEQICQEQREFRKLWWDWHGLHKRCLIAKKAGINPVKFASFAESASKLQNKIQNHSCFQLINPKLRQRFLDGSEVHDALVDDNREIAKRAGIHESQYDCITRDLSQHVHCRPFALSSLRVIKGATDEDFDHLHVVVQYATSFLLLTASGFLSLFPEGRRFTDQRFGFLEGAGLR
ncbi:MAG: hypothetical protein NTY01_25240 [Verrucomicrobia bacterium]|nr:hypothetical protein [Verrucomicrobiota bacterium]